MIKKIEKMCSYTMQQENLFAKLIRLKKVKNVDNNITKVKMLLLFQNNWISILSEIKTQNKKYSIDFNRYSIHNAKI